MTSVSKAPRPDDFDYEDGENWPPLESRTFQPDAEEHKYNPLEPCYWIQSGPDIKHLQADGNRKDAVARPTVEVYTLTRKCNCGNYPPCEPEKHYSRTCGRIIGEYKLEKMFLIRNCNCSKPDGQLVS